jgi:hypothetical protein
LVPLNNGGFARGVIARARPKGRLLLGYFFGPRIEGPNEVSLLDLDPTQPLIRLTFGDLGLNNGTWPIVGTVPDWDRTKWPMPNFVRRDPISQRAWLVEYSDQDPSVLIAEYPTEYDSPLLTDSTYGCGAVEIELTQLLGCAAPQDSTHIDDSSNGRKTTYPIHHFLYFPVESSGKEVARLLRDEGFIVDFQLGADDVNWLVLAKSNAAVTREIIEEQGTVLEQIARDHGGEYDGWEAEGNLL